MDLLSGEFLFILAVTTLVLYFKLRKNRVSTYVPRRSIAIRGKRILCEISKETPLECLLADTQSFGEDFNLKELPELPHSEACKCELIDLNINSSQFFADEGKSTETRRTDLGPLPKNEFRFYKYTLITSHKEIPEEEKKAYLELSESVSVSDKFKEEVFKHLSITPSPTVN